MATLTPCLISLLAATQVYAPDPQSHPQASRTNRSGAEVFATVCAMCHIDDTPGLRAPSVAALRRLSRQNITDALTLGAMTDVGDSLSDKELDAVADFLTTPSPNPSPAKD